MPPMASVHREFEIEAPAERAWSAVRDIGGEDRLFPGVVAASRRDGDHRVVTFASGAVVRERIVSIDDDRRRLAYTLVDSPFATAHHQASLEIVPGAGDASRCRAVWVTDVLPDELAAPIGAVMDQGAAAMQASLAGGAPASQPVGPKRSTRTRSTGTPADTASRLAASAKRADPQT